MSWYLAPSLVTLRDQINARWLNRDKASDGSIGDASHSARVSDHNPDSKGCVHAIDVDKDGIDVPTILAAVLADPRTNYVIWSRRIWLRSRGYWSTYTGSNPHTKHVHISNRYGATYENSTAAWALARPVHLPTTIGGTLPTVTLPTLTPLVPEEDIMASLTDLEDVLDARPARAAFRITGTLGVYLDLGAARRHVSGTQMRAYGITQTDTAPDDPFWDLPIVGNPGELLRRKGNPAAWLVTEGALEWITEAKLETLGKPEPVFTDLPTTHAVWDLPVEGAQPNA